MDCLIVEDLAPGRPDPGPRLDICPDPDEDRYVLRYSQGAATGRDLGTSLFPVAVAGKLPCIEQVGVLVAGEITACRTGIVGIAHGNDTIERLYPVQGNIGVENLADRLVVNAVDNNKVIIRKKVIAVPQIDRIPVVPQSVNILLDRIIPLEARRPSGRTGRSPR
jgi:hypothetical protein